MRPKVTGATLLVASLLVTTSPRIAAPAVSSLDPCALLHRADVARLANWQVGSVEHRRYRLNGATGAMCFFEATDGTVIVIVPDHGAPFPGESPFTDPDSEGVVQHDRRSGIDITYYNSGAYMNVRHHDVAVRLVPTSHIASSLEVEPFATLIAQRIHR